MLERVLKKLAEVKMLVCFIVEIEVPTKHEHLQDDQVAELLKQFKELRIQDIGAVSYVHQDFLLHSIIILMQILPYINF